MKAGPCSALLSPTQDTLTEISEWLEGHPREVVILACRNFEGMTEDLHEYLVTCIKNIFGDMLCPRGVRWGVASPTPVLAGGRGGRSHGRGPREVIRRIWGGGAGFTL